MLKDKRMTAAEAVGLIGDGAFLASAGFMMMNLCEEVYVEIEKQFLATGHPRGLSLMHAAGQGDQATKGPEHLAHEGLLKRYIAGHYAHNPNITTLMREGKMETYNLPQGVIVNHYRNAASGRQGELTKVGLGTYIDPRLDGGKMNAATTEEIVQLVELLGEEYLYYPTPKMDIGLIRGTTADEFGNITMEEEGAPNDALDVAMGVKAQGGKVIVQVKNYVKNGSLHPKSVAIPGNFVDAIVICSDCDAHHRQTPGTFYSPVLAGHYRAGEAGFEPMPMSARKIVARRAALELKANANLNLGIGMPEGIAQVAAEEGIVDQLILSVETGFIGGVPCGDLDFGISINAEACMMMRDIFSFYNGGGLDVSFLGFAEVSPRGDNNVSKLGPDPSGCGGFVDISQSTGKIVFCGTMTAVGFKATVEDGKLKILQEGKKKKFLNEIGQITFSADTALKKGQDVMFVSERCVFRLTKGGLMLTEIAPGMDLERDILANMEFRPLISEDLKVMDERIFRPEPMGLVLK